MSAITLCCPELAVAIFAKQKRVENRSWRVPRILKSSGKGVWLALHVGGSRGMPARIRTHLLKAWDPARARWPWNKMDLTDARRKAPCPLPRGAIVGFIRVAGEHKLKRGEKTENPWALGPICWEIDRAVPLEPPIENVNGKLLLWSVDHEKTISCRERSRLHAAF